MPNFGVNTWVQNNLDEDWYLPNGTALWEGGGLYGQSLLPPYGGPINDNQISAIVREASTNYRGNASVRNAAIASQLWGRVDPTGSQYSDGTYATFDTLQACRLACRQTGPSEQIPGGGSWTGRPPEVP